MDISKEELKNIKIKIFEEYITEEEKKNIDNKINNEIDDIINEFEKESEPIDE